MTKKIGRALLTLTLTLHHCTAQSIEEIEAAADADLARRIEEARAFNKADLCRREEQLRKEEEEGSC